MNKVFACALIAGMAFFASCGPSAEEKAAEEQRVNDSIAAADAAMQAAEAAAMAAAAADSAAMATDSTATDSTAAK